MIGAPEDVVINDDEVPGHGVALVKNILVHALDVVDRHRQGRRRRQSGGEDEGDQQQHVRASGSASHGGRSRSIGRRCFGVADFVNFGPVRVEGGEREMGVDLGLLRIYRG